MALARWFGQPTQPNGSANASAQSSNHAKAVAINKAELKQFGLENVSVTRFDISLNLAHLFHPFLSPTLNVVREHLVRIRGYVCIPPTH